jgi:hypothetical protein
VVAAVELLPPPNPEKIERYHGSFFGGAAACITGAVPGAAAGPA